MNPYRYTNFHITHDSNFLFPPVSHTLLVAASLVYRNTEGIKHAAWSPALVFSFRSCIITHTFSASCDGLYSCMRSSACICLSVCLSVCLSRQGACELPQSPTHTFVPCSSVSSSCVVCSLLYSISRVCFVNSSCAVCSLYSLYSTLLYLLHVCCVNSSCTCVCVCSMCQFYIITSP